MPYRIEVKSRKRPDWAPLVIVPMEGVSRPAWFYSKEEAKRCIASLKENEAVMSRYRTPSTRRSFKLVKTNQPEASPDYAPADQAVFV